MNNRVLKGIYLLGSLSLVGCSFVDSTSTEAQMSEAEVNQATPEMISSWIDKQVLAPAGLSLEKDNIQYLMGSADLNSDGSAEHIVLMQGRFFCGSGGCTGFLFDNNGKVINSMTVVKTPVVLADSYSHGWQDFMVWSNGSYRLMSFNGVAYPSNPSLEPSVNRDANMQAAIANVMASDLYQEDGYDIQPAQERVLWTPANVYYFTFKHSGDSDRIYRARVDMNSGNVEIEAEPNAQ
ncbi:hypothetical protein [Vibrio sp. YIC-376]|uniref:hypothetical protein n=1 Tax=Vibrio sp. YIC-376 TaxID=3136162 RepID=UPI00402ACAB9